MTIEEFLDEWNSTNETLLVHTSGSTGKPKPMMVEKRRMVNSARITCDFLGLEPGNTALLCMSLDYIAGKMMMVRAIERQLSLVSVKPCGHPLSDESLSKAECFTFESSKPGISMPLESETSESSNIFIPSKRSVSFENGFDFVAMVPMQVYNSLKVPIERERLSRIRHLIIGGGAIDEKLASELRKLPNAVWSTYGMTETLSHVALRRLNGPNASDWYQPFDGVGISTNEDGCLVIDAPQVCSQPLQTNDIAEIQVGDAKEPVRFRILGRKDNVICSGGIKIQIEQVEDILRKHLVSPFMIAKKRDEKFGEIAVLITESEKLSEVEAICQTHLPKYWVPKEFLHYDRIPLTETGKPKRNILFANICSKP